MVDILPLGSGSVDPHIFADPDPGSQNLADPTDPDPNHCLKLTETFQANLKINLNNYNVETCSQHFISLNYQKV